MLADPGICRPKKAKKGRQFDGLHFTAKADKGDPPLPFPSGALFNFRRPSRAEDQILRTDCDDDDVRVRRRVVNPVRLRLRSAVPF